MAYGKSKDQFLIKEGKMEIGTLSSFSGSDPQNQFSGDVIGYIKQGSISYEIAREYAEFKNNTPGGLVRKDLITKKITLKFQVGQFNSDLMQLICGSKNDSSGTDSVEWIGADEPTQSEHTFQLTTETVDGKKLYIGILAGRVTTPSVNIALSGTEHAVLDVELEAFESEISGVNVNRTDNYAYFQFAA